jgi:hypothetical protein
MSEEEFWVTIWRNVLIAIVVVILGFSGCTMHQHRQISNVIKSGVAPERAKMAFSSQVSESGVIASLLTLKYDEEKGE